MITEIDLRGEPVFRTERRHSKLPFKKIGSSSGLQIAVCEYKQPKCWMFVSKSRRLFGDYDSNVNPGPGKYEISGSCEKEPPTSKLGTFGRIPQRKRGRTIKIPPPNAYNLPSLCFGEKRDFSRTNCSRVFQKDIAKKDHEKTSDLPAPCDYQSLNAKSGRPQFQGMTSAFKSRTDRSGQKCGNLSLTFPGPGNYEVADSQDTLANSTWAGRSCFLSKSERPGLESKDKVPGPGTYEIKETSVNKRSSGKVKISKKINEFEPVANSFTPQMDPGPGAYNISSGFSAPHFMSSAAFLSNVPRWLPPNAPIGLGMGDMVSGGGPLACAGGADAFSNPGPTRYNPTLPTRMSYHYNTNNGWLY